MSSKMDSEEYVEILEDFFLQVFQGEHAHLSVRPIQECGAHLPHRAALVLPTSGDPRPRLVGEVIGPQLH